MLPFGDILKKLRAEKDWSQAQLAKRLGLSPSMIAHYELGSRFPSLETLADISRVMGVTTDFLLGLNQERECWLDISGLLPNEIKILEDLIESYRTLHEKQ